MMAPENSTSSLPVICVVGSWSSGTTAVTGYLARLGAYSCPPHFMTNDPRTPDSHEPLALKERCVAMAELGTGRTDVDDERFARWLNDWIAEQSCAAREAGCSHIVIKHALLAILIRPIMEVCDPQWILVTRPMRDIEATRTRRGWSEEHGEKGARMIYSTAFSTLMEIGRSYHTIAFGEFLSDPDLRSGLGLSLGLRPDDRQLRDAEAWLR